MSTARARIPVALGILSAVVVAASATAGWLVIRDPGLWLATIPLALVVAGYAVVTGGRHPRGVKGARALAGVAAVTVAVIGMAIVREYAPAAGSAIYVMSALLLTVALRGVWSPQVKASPRARATLVPHLSLAIMIAIGVPLGGSWVEHTVSAAAATALIVIAGVIAVGSGWGIERRLRASGCTGTASEAAVGQP